MNTHCRIFSWIEVPLKLGGVPMPRDREEEQLTLTRRHLPGEQAGSAWTQLPSTDKEEAVVLEEPSAF